MLTLHIEAATHEDLTREAIKVLGIKAIETINVEQPKPLASVPLPPIETATVTATPPAAGTVTLPVPAPRAKRGRPAKPADPVTPISPAPAPSLPPAPSPAPSTTVDNSAPLAADKPVAGVSSSQQPPAPTVDDVRKALGEVNNLFGMAVCTALLGEYGAERVSLVPEATRADFIRACNEKVAKQKAALAEAAAAKS